MSSLDRLRIILIESYIVFLLSHRITEINQLKKRFPRCEIVEENHTFSFMFQPSDPDWVGKHAFKDSLFFVSVLYV